MKDCTSLRGGGIIVSATIVEILGAGNVLDDDSVLGPILALLRGWVLQPALLLFEGGISLLCMTDFFRPVPRLCCLPTPVRRGVVSFWFSNKKVCGSSRVSVGCSHSSKKWRELTVPIARSINRTRQPW